MNDITLPDAKGRDASSSINVWHLTRFTTRVVRYGALLSKQKCFFRAFILASVLRPYGIPAVLNVGLRSLGVCQTDARIDGHCWLSLDNKPFLEAGDPANSYPLFMGRATNGVQYWLGS